MIRAIIVDDEVHCIDTLSILLHDYCPNVTVTDRCMSAKSALAAIEKHKPDLVFLDIEMPVVNGFELLETIGTISFAVIFTTGYDHYAIRAIRFSALDYLLKPIDPKELEAAVKKVVNQKHLPAIEQFSMLMEKLLSGEKGFNKIAIPTTDGFELIMADQIIRCEAENNYTHIFLKNRNKIIACRTLKELEEQMQDFSFFLRVHNSYLANLNEIIKYVRGEGGYLIMSDGSTVNVSRARKEILLKKLMHDK
jgi:two-component system LytT family response regulator